MGAEISPGLGQVAAAPAAIAGGRESFVASPSISLNTPGLTPTGGFKAETFANPLNFPSPLGVDSPIGRSELWNTILLSDAKPVFNISEFERYIAPVENFLNLENPLSAKIATLYIPVPIVEEKSVRGFDPNEFIVAQTFPEHLSKKEELVAKVEELVENPQAEVEPKIVSLERPTRVEVPQRNAQVELVTQAVAALEAQANARQVQVVREAFAKAGIEVGTLDEVGVETQPAGSTAPKISVKPLEATALALEEDVEEEVIIAEGNKEKEEITGDRVQVEAEVRKLVEDGQVIEQRIKDVGGEVLRQAAGDEKIDARKVASVLVGNRAQTSGLVKEGEDGTIPLIKEEISRKGEFVSVEQASRVAEEAILNHPAVTVADAGKEVTKEQVEEVLNPHNGWFGKRAIPVELVRYRIKRVKGPKQLKEAPSLVQEEIIQESLEGREKEVGGSKIVDMVKKRLAKLAEALEAKGSHSLTNSPTLDLKAA
ncbi:hypothetical protein HYS91_00380 [Candidatus Daviesbacteria bacterium]|nr:hypothetical protein [Candidatus Daviesbacteria bacterium]